MPTNPMVLPALLVAALGLFGSGFWAGSKWERGDQAIKVVDAAVTTVDAANTDVEAETGRTVVAAKTEAEARLTARNIRLKGELDALKKSRPECSRDADSIRLLNDAIETANGKAPSAPVLPESMRPVAFPAQRVGAGDQELGIPGD